MRSSAWSLRVISACSAALVLAPNAWAHVSIDPPRVAAGAEVELTFSVPNENDRAGIEHVTLGVPADFQLDDAESKPGWRQSRTGQAVTWSGGAIPKGQYAMFSVRGTAPPKVETVLFNVVVGDRTGKSITYRVGLDVVASARPGTSGNSLGEAALVVAIAAAVLALGAGFLALYVWLRPPP